VNANAYTLSVSPAAQVGTPAKLNVDGSGYFEIINQVTTSRSGAPNVEISERDAGDRVSVTVTGSVPVGGAPLALPRRVISPLYYAGYVFIDALSIAGIRAPAKVVLGSCAADAPLIARHESQPLAQMLTRLGKNSDNFVAEMLVKVIGAEHDHKPGTTQAGVAVVKDSLRRHGLPATNVTMINGSGLFQGNLVPTELISQLLVNMYQDPGLRAEFVSHLAVGGVDGTLARRFSKISPARIVRAKTGTLNDVIALSGYVLGPSPGRAYVFSFLANGVKGKQAEARALIDHIIEELATDLYSAAARNATGAGSRDRP
jgi:D-alanyl-D-alanine carboxypeptidase/D-alanyl-D-alanine-endopeptidase (penicillin-binding protein 4)